MTFWGYWRLNTVCFLITWHFHCIFFTFFSLIFPKFITLISKILFLAFIIIILSSLPRQIWTSTIHGFYKLDKQWWSTCPPRLTVWLSYAYHELRVKGLAQPLGVHQLHGAVLQATLNVWKDRLVPRVQHQLWKIRRELNNNTISFLQPENSEAEFIYEALLTKPPACWVTLPHPQHPPHFRDLPQRDQINIVWVMF